MRIASILLASLLSACSGAGDPAAQGGGGAAPAKEIVIGQYGSTSGTAATFGISTQNGIAIATDEQNAKGGISGATLRMVFEDDRSNAEEAATAVNKIISRDRPVAVLGEVSSSRSLAAAPLLQAAGIPMISPSSTSPKVTQVGNFIFRVCFMDDFQGAVIARFAYTDKGIRNAAILKDVKNDYSVGLAQYFTETFTGLGGTIVGEEAYSEQDIDFKAQLSSLIAKKPDAMVLTGYYTETGLIALQARQLGYTGIFLGGDGWDSEKLVELGQDAIVGSYHSNHYAADDPSPVIQDFVTKYTTRFGGRPDALAGLGYDAARILYASLEEVAKNPVHFAALTDRSAVPATEGARKAARLALRDQIATTQAFRGVTGSITIDEGRNATKSATMVEVTKAGPKFVTKIDPAGTPAPTTEGAPTGDAPAPAAPADAAPAAP